MLLLWGDLVVHTAQLEDVGVHSRGLGSRGRHGSGSGGRGGGRRRRGQGSGAAGLRAAASGGKTTFGRVQVIPVHIGKDTTFDLLVARELLVDGEALTRVDTPDDVQQSGVVLKHVHECRHHILTEFDVLSKQLELKQSRVLLQGFSNRNRTFSSNAVVGKIQASKSTVHLQCFGKLDSSRSDDTTVGQNQLLQVSIGLQDFRKRSSILSHFH
mmetsp:Transcript_49029/g.123337  ORF Transcript_49029/g.123337 Transcript_49029/m.123337 type:complete len:213 (+) Transcript_49029:154-792(+)